MKPIIGSPTIFSFFCAQVSLEAHAIADASVRGALERTRQRIAAIAEIHRQLYRQDDREAVDLSDYLKDLARNLQPSCPPNARVWLALISDMASKRNAAYVWEGAGPRTRFCLSVLPS
jgi:two-component sensor histidine kinase